MKKRSGLVRTFDGDKVFYESKGDGPLTIMCFNGVGVSRFFWRYVERYFVRMGIRIVKWDYRGHGKSPFPKNWDNISMEINARDARAILDHLKIEKVILIGHSMGVQAILEFYHLFPNRVLGLIPVLGTYEHPVDTFFNWKGSIYFYNLGKFLAYNFPTFFQKVWNKVMGEREGKIAFYLAKLFIIHPTMCRFEDMKPYFKHLTKIDLKLFFKMAEAMQKHSARSYLKSIKVPVLIIAGEKDVFTPLWLSIKMYKMIPESEILILKEGSHAGLVEQPDLINLRIEKFIREHFPHYIIGKQEVLERINAHSN